MDINLKKLEKGDLKDIKEVECDNCGYITFRYLGENGFMCENCEEDYVYDDDLDMFKLA